MPIYGDYVPSQMQWVADQVETYEASGGAEANTLRDTGIPVIIVTMLGRSGKVRKIALMRVEHDGEYALIASYGGAPTNPAWYDNMVANKLVTIQDGATPFDYEIHEVFDDERNRWFERGVRVFAPYAEYQTKTDRLIPVLVATKAARQYRNNTDAQRYELTIDGELASLVEYRPGDGAIDLPHTETKPKFGGQGNAARVVEFALDDLARQHRLVRPQCSFVAGFIDQHPTYQSLVVQP